MIFLRTIEWGWYSVNNRAAAVDGRDHKGERAIDVAARVGFVSVVQALLENGANPNTQTNNGRQKFVISYLQYQIVMGRQISHSKSRVVSYHDSCGRLYEVDSLAESENNFMSVSLLLLISMHGLAVCTQPRCMATSKCSGYYWMLGEAHL